MTFTSYLARYVVVSLICAVSFASLTSPVSAQIPPEQAKIAGGVQLSTVLLDKIDSLLKKVGSDPAAKAEYIAAGKDAGAKPENMTELVQSKYPKLAAIFKTSDLTPFEFMNASGTLFMSFMLAEAGTLAGDTRADANIAFCKANKDRVTATTTALEAIEKGETSAAAPSPSAPSSSSPSKTAPSSDLTIVSATYGDEDNEEDAEDVTEMIQKKVKEGRLELSGDFSSEFGDDSAPDKKKTLTIIYSKGGGKETEKKFREGEKVSLP